MTAKEAQEKAIAANVRKQTSQYQEIISLIKDAADAGEYKINYYHFLEGGVHARLVSDGYVIDNKISVSNETLIVISYA